MWFGTLGCNLTGNWWLRAAVHKWWGRHSGSSGAGSGKRHHRRDRPELWHGRYRDFSPWIERNGGGGGDGRALAIQPLDQKILVAGTWRATQAGNSQVFVARFGTTGVLDATFGVNGVVLFTPAGVTNPETNALGLRSDGSIILPAAARCPGQSGFYYWPYQYRGPIPGFSDALVENPLVNGDNFGFNSVVVLPGDGILAAGAAEILPWCN